MNEWAKAQEWERNWWGFCNNTFHEEERQYVYARYMGLEEFATNWYGNRGWDFGNLSIVDIGGGPASMLLKSKAKRRVVVDPCNFPAWIKRRYDECRIEFWKEKGENLYQEYLYHLQCAEVNTKDPVYKFDMALIYNVLQHTDKPEAIIENAILASREIRIFEWLDTPISDGHIHSLKAEKLNSWLGGNGKVIEMKGEAGLVGKAYAGIFPC